ncbi:unnamed protein product [Phytophthora lilii]|uniref:Unnamed protein product n=1 Tax=Phytophthora lilii TaxID=2077276 RepID=A0A9W6U0A9_9STRA|nr:unnamed protein product [Phytophthora lilii]
MMIRLRVVFALLVAVSGFPATEGIDWTFWNDDDSSASESTSIVSATASPKSTNSAVSSSLDAATAVDLSSGSSSIDDDEMLSSMATHASAKSTVESTYRNWVGPWSISPDAACYREAHIMDTCPQNYDRNEATNTCWTECPLAYPVECGMECIQQNSDCGMEVASKVTAVAMTIFSSATFGVFGELAKLGQTISWAVKCTNSMMLVMRGIIRYIRNMKTEDPQASDRKILLLLYQTGTVVTDLPIAITVCMGKAVSPNLRMSQYVIGTAQSMLMQALAHDDDIISSWAKFRAFLK